MKIDEKLDMLRELMAEKKLKAYIVADSDPHMSEYVAKHWKMRRWLSGFTGSAGVVALTLDKSGLWTDGRYYIQAEKELLGSEIELFRSGEPDVPSYIEWLTENLSKGDRVGVFGGHFSAASIEKLERDLGREGIQAVTEYDLIGEIWADREPMPKEPIFIHDTKYAGKSSSEKVDTVRDRMRKNRADYYLIGSLDDIAWLYNIRGNDVPFNPVTISYALISHQEAWLFIDPSKVGEDVIEHLLSQGIQILDYEAVDDKLRELIDSKDSIYIDPNRLNYGLYNTLEKIGCNIIEDREITADLKAIKNEVEIENLRKTLIRDGVAMVKFLYWLDSNLDNGITEIEAAEKVDEFRAEQDENRGASFTSISAYRDHAAMMHYSPVPETQHTLKREGMYLLDSGGQYLGGTTDITRTIVLGPISEMEKRDFTLVLKGNISLSRAKFLYGATGPNLDVLARQPIWRYGLDYKCGTGHGVGFYLNVHEGPQNLSQRVNNVKLEAGMILTNEPGIYKEGEYGIRTENMMLVAEDEKTDCGQFMRFDIITYCPIDIDGIDVDLLDDEERVWLNDYHRQVYEKLSPYLNDNEKTWLKEATREL